jgi:hypothetical protein
LHLKKANIHLFISLVIIQRLHQVLHVICTSGQNKTRLSKTKWAREPCSHAADYIRGYKLTSYLLA